MKDNDRDPLEDAIELLELVLGIVIIVVIILIHK